jgi:lipid II:glycine glycyltransferase (peptidoglycan interpeptide bridge formation enzyme)
VSLISDAPPLSATGSFHAELVNNRERWNGVLATLSGAELEHGYEWGEVLRDTGWRPCRFAVFRGGVPIAGVAVLVRTFPGLPLSIGYAPRGPLADPDDPGAWRALDAVWRQVAAEHRLVFVRASAARRMEDLPWSAALERNGFTPLPMQWTTWNMPRIVVTLDLVPSTVDLGRRLRKQIRQAIAAAERRGVGVRCARSVDDVRRFHELLVETARGRYPVRPATRMLALWREYIARGQGVVLFAEHGGETLGGLCGVRAGRRAAFQAMAIRRDPPSLDMDQGALLYWSFIQWAKAAGCEVIDWGGSATQYPPHPSDQGWGVYQFKRGFGCTLEYRLPYYDRVFQPRLYRLFRALEERVLPRAWRWRARLNR